ncbi:RNA polymerase sigma factor [Pontibacter sp. G13]|uniref:RNA polymerase sigma factor n=1 Tax=Pontibacter sp. G13 TaxID=3074898 RepID=UPI00288C15A4|nr:RNA polymerase sigma factor [Pontibacter sp. G13]WNJ21122.1 RNA polymerase sigma factor [Pontibacter sp. G13]
MTALEFNTAVVNLYKSLKPIAFKLTRDTEEANDLLQETLLKAIANRDKFTDGTNLKAWLYTIMKNTFITNYHRLVKRKTFIDTTENLHFINSSFHVTENGAGSKLAMDEIDTAIKDLNHEYKTPFMMHYKGYKYFEIADILNIPIGTVKNRIHIARKELKGKLKSYAKP